MASQLPRSASFNRSHNVEAVAMRKAFCQLEFSRRHDAREVPERIQTPSNHRPLQHTGPRFVQSSQPDCAMASQPSRPTVIDQNSKFGILLRGSARPAPRYRRSRHRATTPTKAVEHAKQVPHFDANRKSIAAAVVTTSGNLRPNGAGVPRFVREALHLGFGRKRTARRGDRQRRPMRFLQRLQIRGTQEEACGKPGHSLSASSAAGGSHRSVATHTDARRKDYEKRLRVSSGPVPKNRESVSSTTRLPRTLQAELALHSSMGPGRLQKKQSSEGTG